MKRGKPLNRRTPLKATKGLSRTKGILTRPDHAMKRGRLAPMSENRRDVNRERAKRLREAWGPKRTWRCEVRRRGLELCGWHPLEGNGRIGQETKIGKCHGQIHAHELTSRARAGTDANLVDVDGMIPLCDFHNGWCEDNPDAAHALGLTRHSWEGR